MDIESKKFLAERMGWESEHPKGGLVFFIMTKDEPVNTILKSFMADKWNPDTNHEQFKDVWNKLTDNQRTQVEIKTIHNSVRGSFVWILLNDLPKVVKEVIEVLKEKEC